MNVNQTTCAAADHDSAWKSIDWKKCEAQVKKLQERIVKARKEGRHQMYALGNSQPSFFEDSQISEITVSPLFFTLIL